MECGLFLSNAENEMCGFSSDPVDVKSYRPAKSNKSKSYIHIFCVIIYMIRETPSLRIVDKVKRYLFLTGGNFYCRYLKLMEFRLNCSFSFRESPSSVKGN